MAQRDETRSEKPVDPSAPSVRPGVLDPTFELHPGPPALPSISRPDTCLHPTHARLVVLQRFHLRQRGRPHRQVTLGEQQAVSPQPLEPPCGILVEGGKRRAVQAGPLKRDDSIGEVAALVE